MKQAGSEISVTLTERISVLLDGELDQPEAGRIIAALASDAALQREWHELHRAGDALRSQEVAACDAEGFCAKIAAAIAAEPAILAPRATRGSPGLRRYWVPGIAVAASMAAIGFIAVPLLRAPQAVSLVKNAAPPAIEVSPADAQNELATIVNARQAFNPYLAAHRELAGNSVVPRAAVYLRSDEGR